MNLKSHLFFLIMFVQKRQQCKAEQPEQESERTSERASETKAKGVDPVKFSFRYEGKGAPRSIGLTQDLATRNERKRWNEDDMNQTKKKSQNK